MKYFCRFVSKKMGALDIIRGTMVSENINLYTVFTALAFTKGKGKRKSWPGFYPVRGGVKVMGQTASLLAKAAPSLPHHSSIGSLSLPMTIFLEF